MRPSILSCLVLATAVSAALGQGHAAAADMKAQLNEARAELAPTQGNRARGTLTLSPDSRGLRISGTVANLRANGEHGFHVHAVGDCSAADASSAGDHFNPGNHNHGNPRTSAPNHAGDMPNLRADARGTATFAFRITGVTLGDGGDADVLGKAIVVHADADDYSSQPAGNAGARIACGVIEATPAPALAPQPIQEAAPATQPAAG
ncbi:MAG: superoxide dismutase family protein [Xanthomonadales bacterium]|nr:superoxide dismutase family protein [Xanthomonadales bacterium]